MLLCAVVYLFFLFLLATTTNAFAPPLRHATSNALHMVDPTLIAVAVASASAGAATQMPRIQQLEEGNQKKIKALKQSQIDYEIKVADMEEQLFQMDAEFEAASAQEKVRFENRVRTEVDKMRAQIKQEYAYTLEIKLQEERAAMLQEKLAFIGATNGEKDQELVALRLNQAQLEQLNVKLQSVATEAKEELANLRSSRERNKGFWPF